MSLMFIFLACQNVEKSASESSNTAESDDGISTATGRRFCRVLSSEYRTESHSEGLSGTYTQESDCTWDGNRQECAGSITDYDGNTTYFGGNGSYSLWNDHGYIEESRTISDEYTQTITNEYSCN